MKEINIINLDQNEKTLLPQHYNIGFTHFSSLYYPYDQLDGVISFAGSLVEFKEDILIDKNIPSVLLQTLMNLLNKENITYTLHSEAVDFSSVKVNESKVLTLDIADFDFDLYAIYAVSMQVSKEQLNMLVLQFPTAFKVRIMNEIAGQYDVFLNISHDDLCKSLDILKHHCD